MSLPISLPPRCLHLSDLLIGWWASDRQKCTNEYHCHVLKMIACILQQYKEEIEGIDKTNAFI